MQTFQIHRVQKCCVALLLLIAMLFSTAAIAGAANNLPMYELPVLSDETAQKIQQDYANILQEKHPSDDFFRNLTANDVLIEAYYGNHNGYEIILMGIYGFSYTNDMAAVEIAGYTFTFTSSSRLTMFFAYKDGKFYPVKDAYQSGLLSKQDMWHIAVNHAHLGTCNHRFLDVADNSWYSPAVQFTFGGGLFAGTSNTAFSPNYNMTRAMLVAVLYRLDGSPAVTGTCGFLDISSGAYYTDAVTWASGNGIIYGVSAAVFGPNDAVTREQMAAILLRYAKHRGYNSNVTATFEHFTDADFISGYARQAMQWAVGSGLIVGRSETELVPTGTATRAEVATILMRFVEKVMR